MALALLPFLFVLASASAAPNTTPKQEKSLAENIFKLADANSDGRLDEAETSQAQRAVRGALIERLPSDVPGGKATRDRIINLSSKPIQGSKNGTTLEELTRFVTSVFEQRDDILKDARKKEAEELAKDRKRDEERLRKAREQAEKERQKLREKLRKLKK